MINLPLPIKIILNTLIGVMYFIFMFFSGSFIGGFIAGMTGYEGINTSIIVKILGIISAIGIVLTIIYRENFYLMKHQPKEIDKEK